MCASLEEYDASVTNGGTIDDSFVHEVSHAVHISCLNGYMEEILNDIKCKSYKFMGKGCQIDCGTNRIIVVVPIKVDLWTCQMSPSSRSTKWDVISSQKFPFIQTCAHKYPNVPHDFVDDENQFLLSAVVRYAH